MFESANENRVLVVAMATGSDEARFKMADEESTEEWIVYRLTIRKNRHNKQEYTAFLKIRCSLLCLAFVDYIVETKLQTRTT